MKIIQQGLYIHGKVRQQVSTLEKFGPKLSVDDQGN